MVDMKVAWMVANLADKRVAWKADKTAAYLVVQME
jgi:hypothetical protein